LWSAARAGSPETFVGDVASYLKAAVATEAL
jgi:hypothetical protein